MNRSLIVLRKPEKNFEKLLDLLTEINYLLGSGPTDQRISLQVSDVHAQWTNLTELITELRERAERTREHFLIQFSWVLQEFLRSGPSFPDALREFIISLLLPKMVEIDQISDLLGMITLTYSDISSLHTDDQTADNGHLIILSQERDRQSYLNQFRHKLPSEVVEIARLALKRHKEFLQRNQNRQADYETFLDNASNANLTKLIRK